MNRNGEYLWCSLYDGSQYIKRIDGEMVAIEVHLAYIIRISYHTYALYIYTQMHMMIFRIIFTHEIPSTMNGIAKEKTQQTPPLSLSDWQIFVHVINHTAWPLSATLLTIR